MRPRLLTYLSVTGKWLVGLVLLALFLYIASR